MYVHARKRLGGLFHWWGVAPTPVAKAIAVGGCAYATGGAATGACQQIAAKYINDPAKKAPVVPEGTQQSASGGNWLSGVSGQQIALGAGGVLLLALLLRR